MGATARASGRRRLAAVSLALLAHAALLGLFLTGSGRLHFQPGPQQRSTEVWLAPPLLLRPPPAQRRKEARERPQSRAVSPSQPPVVVPAQRSPTPEAAPEAPSTAPPGPGVSAGVAAALRGRVGCAEPNAPWMSDADRAGCRERLAAGAARAPHLQAMSPVKLAYFNAVAKAQADWLSGRDAGHGLAIGCIHEFGPGVRTPPPPHALRLGPCMIEPPRGSLDIDVDILPDGETAKGPPAFLTSGHGPFSRPGS